MSERGGGEEGGGCDINLCLNELMVGRGWEGGDKMTPAHSLWTKEAMFRKNKGLGRGQIRFIELRLLQGEGFVGGGGGG